MGVFERHQQIAPRQSGTTQTGIFPELTNRRPGRMENRNITRTMPEFLQTHTALLARLMVFLLCLGHNMELLIPNDCLDFRGTIDK
ncbi:MAG: hypothetical protein B6D71_00685 [gamma proteobacterium symbiont of Stewartia floridana]|nr:MAG: hypothetical protein B6D71_00685 [gamma proteobacterium symbiont of Stewartia floridana]